MDMSYLLFLQNLRESLPEFVSKFMLFVTHADLYLLFLLPLFLFWCVSKKAGSFVGFAANFSALFNSVIKLTFCIYRPWIKDAAIIPYGNAHLTATGYSFPSGHSVVAASLYGSVGFEYRKYRWFFVLMIFAALLTGFSRNYLGCHTPQDVVVGLVEGALEIVVIKIAIDWAYAQEGRAKWFVIANLIFFILAVLYGELKSYPMDFINGKLLVNPEKMKMDLYYDGGMYLGAVVGWYLEQRFVKFTLDVPIWKKVLRFLIGGAGALVIHMVVEEAILTSGLYLKAAQFSASFLLMFYVYFLGPLALRIIDGKETSN